VDHHLKPSSVHRGAWQRRWLPLRLLHLRRRRGDRSVRPRSLPCFGFQSRPISFLGESCNSCSRSMRYHDSDSVHHKASNSALQRVWVQASVRLKADMPVQRCKAKIRYHAIIKEFNTRNRTSTSGSHTLYFIVVDQIAQNHQRNLQKSKPCCTGVVSRRTRVAARGHVGFAQCAAMSVRSGRFLVSHSKRL